MLYTLIDKITPDMLSKATYMCESSEGMSVLRYGDKIFYLGKSKYTPTCAPAVDDLYCVIKKKTNKAIITDSIREMMQAYLTDFSHSDEIASCKFDNVVETEIPNFIINTQIPLDIRLNIARPLVDETLKDVSIEEARKVELTTIVASTGTTEELMKLVEQLSTTPAIEGIEDTEEPEIEEELSKLSKEEKQMFLDEMGIKQSGLDSVIKAAYHLLGLKTFFTVGEPECRAWTFKDGMLAPDCAGVIHTDFKKGFIRAETYSYDDLMEYKTEASLKEHGKLRLEGKDYVVQDGDVMHFRFNV